MRKYFLSFLLLYAQISFADISQRVKDCLHECYALDNQTVAVVMEKMQPLLDNEQMHGFLEEFVAVSTECTRADEKSSGPRSVQSADDAVMLAPEDHLVISENARVRVLWSCSGHGDYVPYHRHYEKSVMLIVMGSIFEIMYADGTQERSEYPVGVYDLPADTQPTAYKNIGGNFRALRFEVKQ